MKSIMRDNEMKEWREEFWDFGKKKLLFRIEEEKIVLGEEKEIC